MLDQRDFTASRIVSELHLEMQATRRTVVRLKERVRNLEIKLRLQRAEEDPPPHHRPTIKDLVRIACSITGRQRPTDILSARRDARLVRVRHVIMWLAKRFTLHSLPDIGRALGNRDHTTVLHGVRKIDHRVAELGSGPAADTPEAWARLLLEEGTR